MNDIIAILLDRMRSAAPLVHCMTNYVAMDIAANVLLAAGASPAMVHAEEEAAEFTAIAGALTINIGTLSSAWVEPMHQAAKAANAHGKPWVFDPVAHFATRYRRETARSLLALKPSVIRANASEIIALAGGVGGGKGVDSGDSVAQAEASALELARAHGTIVALTGETDFVTDGARSVRIAGGSPLMPKVTALGCSLTCLTGAFLAVAPGRHLEAVTAALALFAVAGERVHKASAGPGSFRWRFLDELSVVSPPALAAEARVTSA